MKRPLVIGLSPNLEFNDITLALKNLFQGKIFKQEDKPLFALRQWFKNKFVSSSVYFFNSGRSALFVALKASGLKKGDEVVLQAFTCVAVVNSIIWAGGTPVYVDIDKENLGMDPTDLRKKITSKTKAIIVTHTFGLPAKIEEILKIASVNKLLVIEDCAHAIGISHQNRKLGSFADMTIFSFGRDKAISSVFGGALMVNNRNLVSLVDRYYQKLKNPSHLWVLSQYLHILSMGLILPLYDFFKLGRLLLFLLFKLKILIPPVSDEEKESKKPKCFPQKLPSALAYLVFHQVNKLEKFNKLRKSFVSLYNRQFPQKEIITQDLPYLRYPLLIEERDKFLELAKKENIVLGNWYHNVVDPAGLDLKRVYYTNPCPTAEYVAQYIINLPTSPTLSFNNIQKVISLFKKYKVHFR